MAKGKRKARVSVEDKCNSGNEKADTCDVVSAESEMRANEQDGNMIE